jgi:hypothetical protein
VCAAGAGYNETAQVVCYEALFQAVYSQPWFEGLFIWAWLSNPDDRGSGSPDGFTPNGRAAASVVQQYFK